MLYTSFRRTSVSDTVNWMFVSSNDEMKLIQDIQCRQASPFTRPEWQAIPFRKHIKGPDQKLYDIGAEVSTIITRAGSSRNKGTPDDRAHIMALLEDCQQLHDKIAVWLENLNKAIPPPHHWTELATMHNPADELENRKVFSVAFHFPNLFIAKIMLDYWALSIILDDTTFRLCLSLKGEGKSPRSQRAHPADDWNVKAAANISNERVVSLPQAAQYPRIMKASADNIAQSMEYYLSREMGVLGPQWALFALRAALQTYRYFPNSKELRWLQAIHDEISDQKGVNLCRIIASTSWTRGSIG